MPCLGNHVRMSDRINRYQIKRGGSQLQPDQNRKQPVLVRINILLIEKCSATANVITNAATS